MISFNSLGSLGFFSNQMFQYAALRGVCEYHGYYYKFIWKIWKLKIQHLLYVPAKIEVIH